jgi:hypothetical protein
MVSGRSRGELGWPPGAGASQKGEPSFASVVPSRRFVDDCLGFERFLDRLWRRRWHCAQQSRNTGRHFDHFHLRHSDREQFTANCKYSADCGVGRARGIVLREFRLVRSRGKRSLLDPFRSSFADGTDYGHPVQVAGGSGSRAGLPVGSLQALTHFRSSPTLLPHLFFPELWTAKPSCNTVLTRTPMSLRFCSSNEPRHIVLCVGARF